MSAQVGKEAIDVGIVTTNGDAMLEFYRDVIGLEYEATLNMEQVGIAQMHRVWFGKTLVKIVVPVKGVDDGPSGGMMGSTGIRYITLTVKNLDEVLGACEAAGATIVWPRREVRPGVVIGMVEDPDGNWVEFIDAPDA
jgi:glyoxylase I family protein